MLKQRQQSNQQYTHQQQRELQKYYSVKADLTFKQNTKYIPRGKIIRNQISKSNANCTNKLDNKKAHTLTPQCVKIQHEKKRKKSEQQDIRSFKLEQSNVNSKYFTIKKDLRQEGSEKTKKGQNVDKKKEQIPKEVGNGTIHLNQGWKYKGQYSSGVFHGYGELLYHNQIIYKGKFEFGYFHGYGKLQNCPIFNYLVPKANLKGKLGELQQKGSNKNVYSDLDDINWDAYIGQFKRGQLSGFGELWMKSYKIVGCWQKGKLKAKTALIVNDDTI